MTGQDWLDILQLLSRLWLMGWASYRCVRIYRKENELDWVIVVYVMLSMIGMVFVCLRLFTNETADEEALRPWITPTTIVSTFLLGVHFGNGRINSTLASIYKWILPGLSRFSLH